MFGIFVIFRLFLSMIQPRSCAGCASQCAGFVQGMKFCNLLIFNRKNEAVQSVHPKKEKSLACRRWRGRVHARVYTRTISFKPCTPFTIIHNLLKKRKKVYFKTLHKLCTNPAQGMHTL